MKLKHWTELTCYIDMACYSAFYQAVVRETARANNKTDDTTIIVEAGVRYGCSARIFMDAMKSRKNWHLYLLDPFPKEDALVCQGDHVTFIAKTAELACDQFTDASIDLLHIDVDYNGTHPYELTRGVFDALYPKLKPSARVIFHDATESFPGVLKVISELAADGWSVRHCLPAPECPIAAPAVLKRG
jgi:hypothetical protein